MKLTEVIPNSEFARLIRALSEARNLDATAQLTKAKEWRVTLTEDAKVIVWVWSAINQDWIAVQKLATLGQLLDNYKAEKREGWQ